MRAEKAGATGFLWKDNAEAFVAESIRKVHAGGLFINQSVAERLTMNILQGRHAEMPHNRLTDREYQVFLLIVQGMGVTEIGRHLNLSVKTVSTHKASIQVKMDLANTAELVRYAVENNLIDSNAAAAK